MYCERGTLGQPPFFGLQPTNSFQTVSKYSTHLFTAKKALIKLPAHLQEADHHSLRLASKEGNNFKTKREVFFSSGVGATELKGELLIHPSTPNEC